MVLMHLGTQAQLGLTGLNGASGVVHVASGVGQDLGLPAALLLELANGLAVFEGLLRSARVGELDVLHAEFSQGGRDLDLGRSVKESVGKLFAL